MLNIVGVIFFHDAPDPHHVEEENEDEDTSDEKKRSDNMEGVFLHVVADSLGSMGVIVSTILVKYYGMTIADPICSFLIATMILASSIPFIKMTARQFLLEASPRLKKRL